MDLQTFEALQNRVATLERRLLLAVAGLFFVSVSLLVSVLVQNAYAQSSLVRAAGDEVTRTDLNAIQREINEFRGEVAAIELRVTATETTMAQTIDLRNVLYLFLGTWIALVVAILTRRTI